MGKMEKISMGQESFINTYKPFPVLFDYGKGVYMYDIEGKKYLDFVAGIAVNSLGYGNEKLNNALKNQIDKFLHCSNLYWNESAIDAANILSELSGLDRVFFCNSGAEANEGAMKLARKYAKKYVSKDRYEIISMKNSFHGRTIGAITATGQEKYQKDLSPLLPGIKYCEYNNINSLKETINDNTCAIIVEVIQGEGGIVPADFEYIKEIRNICDDKNIVLIIDEVQTGIGRTGKTMAYEHYDIRPDIVTLAKGLGSGIVVGAIVANDKVAKGFEPGDHASTFGGNPIACTAVNVVLNEIKNGDLLRNVKEQGDYLKEKLKRLKSQYSFITDVRGIGLMLGIEVTIPVSTVVSKSLEKGLLLVGASSNVIRFVPPLVVTNENIDEAILILEEVFNELEF